MTLAEFVRVYPLKAKNIAWFFGAGSSVSAGMPTASDLTWEFKRRIYCSEESIQLSLFNNLSDSTIRNQIQAYFASKQGYPQVGSVEEYSFYFEIAFRSANDRSNFLTEQLSGLQNSYGHKAIGILMKNGLIPLIFTTNFDKALENAAVGQLKRMDAFLVADLENNSVALRKYNEGFRPMVVKIHGDYFSDKLKNTQPELQEQNNKLRQVLLNSCLTNGLAVMGYSGRDESVIEVFKEAIHKPGAFSNGLFWFNRAGSTPLPVVKELIQLAQERMIQAEFVELETFDTAWADIIKGFHNLPSEDVSTLNANYFRTGKSTIPRTGKNYPVIRLNAIRILEFPATARLAKCQAGNTKEIKGLLKQNDADILAVRKNSGVVGFGPDSIFENVLRTYGNIQMDVFSITEKMLIDEDPSIKGLITEALVKAVCRDRPLKYRKKRESYVILPDPKKIEDPVFKQLKGELSSLFGKIPGSNSSWIACLEISVQVKFSKVLLIAKPSILSSISQTDSDRFTNAAYIKEATARWYNTKFQTLFDSWIDILFESEKELYVSAYEENTVGFNGKFKLSKEPTFAKSM